MAFLHNLNEHPLNRSSRDFHIPRYLLLLWSLNWTHLHANDGANTKELYLSVFFVVEAEALATSTGRSPDRLVYDGRQTINDDGHK